MVLLTSSEKYVNSQRLTFLQHQQRYQSDWSGLFAAIVIVMMPMLVVIDEFQAEPLAIQPADGGPGTAGKLDVWLPQDGVAGEAAVVIQGEGKRCGKGIRGCFREMSAWGGRGGCRLATSSL